MLQYLSWFLRLLVSLPKHVSITWGHPCKHSEPTLLFLWRWSMVLSGWKIVWGRRPSRVGLPRMIPWAQNAWLARIISNLLLNSQVKPERSACSVILYIQLNTVRLFETVIVVITLMYIPYSMLKIKLYLGWNIFKLHFHFITLLSQLLTFIHPLFHSEQFCQMRLYKSEFFTNWLILTNLVPTVLDLLVPSCPILNILNQGLLLSKFYQKLSGRISCVVKHTSSVLPLPSLNPLTVFPLALFTNIDGDVRTYNPELNIKPQD